MKNVENIPAHQGSNFKLLVPNVQFFLDKINNKEYFSMPKYSVETLMMMRKALSLMKIRLNQVTPQLLQSKPFINDMAKNIVHAWHHGQSYGRQFQADTKALRSLVSAFGRPTPDNLLFGFSNTAIHSGPLPPPRDKHNVADFIQTFTTVAGKVPYNAFIWRSWAYSGEIHTFLSGIAKNKKLKIVIVGPFLYKNFGYKMGLKNFEHIEIDKYKALIYINKTKREIIRRHKTYVSQGYDVLYLFIGGSAATCMVLDLHSHLERAFMLDIGMAVNVYYFHDEIVKRKKNVGIVWGHWLTKRKVRWVFDITQHNPDGVTTFKL